MALPERVGEYRIVREIGRGGMGVVCEAVQESLDRRVALKLLTGIAAQDAQMIERFDREARAAASLSHPGIVQVHGVGHDDGLHYIAMEYVDGTSLAHHLRAFWDAETRIETATAEIVPPAEGDFQATFHVDMDEVTGGEPPTSPTTVADATTETRAAKLPGRRLRPLVKLVIQAARALHAAHEAGILHRDVKPGNLLLTSSGAVKVADFGLARMVEGQDRITRTGDIMGTPSYVSPEQLRGKAVSRQADVYSLGVTLYEAVCGQLPFEADSVQSLMHQILHREPPRPRKVNPTLPRDLETITLKAVEKEPDRRYETAEALADDLERWLKDEPILARPAGAVTRVMKLIRRRRGVTAALLLAIIVAGVAWWQIKAAEHDRLHAESEVKVADAISNSVQGNSGPAIRQYAEAILLDPHVRYAHVFRAVEHLRSGHEDDAQSDLETAQRQAPDDEVVALAWEYFQRRTESWSGGETPVFDAESMGRDDLLALDAMGLAYSYLGRYLLAHAFFEKARDADRQRISSLVGFGFTAFNLGHYSEAKEAFSALKALMPPENPLPRLVLIYCLWQQSRKATPEVRRFLAREGRNLVRELVAASGPSPFASLACATVDDMIPSTERLEGDHEPTECVQAAIAQAGGAMDRLPALFHEIAGYLLAHRDPDVARRHAELALTMRPESELARATLGFVHHLDGEDDLALERFRQAVERAPDAAETITGLIRSADPDRRFKVKAKNPVQGEELLSLCRKLVEIAPDDAAGLILAAKTLQRVGDAATARRGYTLALQRAESQERKDLAQEARAGLDSLDG